MDATKNQALTSYGGIPMKFFVRVILLLSLFPCLLFMTPAYSLDEDSGDDTGRDEPQVYHLYNDFKNDIKNDIDLISTVKYQYNKKPNLFIKSVYPQLESD